MAVNLPNPGTYLAQLGNDVVMFRDALQRLLNDAAYLASIGGVTALEAPPFSLSAADAQLIMSTVGGVTPSNPVVVSIEGFLTATEPLWGGQ